jgi:hypothetical protein
MELQADRRRHMDGRSTFLRERDKTPLSGERCSMRYLPLLAAIILSDCVRSTTTHSAPLEEDTSIVFPKFYERFPVVVGGQGLPYELDGVTLRAITIAANDFIPPGTKERPCWQRQEAHRYRVIRRGDIIFVDISWDRQYCEVNFGILDGGVRYAISTDGRILRRLFDGEPEGPLGPEAPDAGDPQFKGTSVPLSSLGSLYGEPVPNALPPGWLDGGIGPMSPVSRLPKSSSSDGGTPDGDPSRAPSQ